MIYFEVKDDGLGINSKKVMDGGSSGVGIRNTDERLRSTFGPGSGLRIHSSTWGYSVSFFIPIMEENQGMDQPEEMKRSAV